METRYESDDKNSPHLSESGKINIFNRYLTQLMRFLCHQCCHMWDHVDTASL